MVVFGFGQMIGLDSKGWRVSRILFGGLNVGGEIGGLQTYIVTLSHLGVGAGRSGRMELRDGFSGAGRGRAAAIEELGTLRGSNGSGDLPPVGGQEMVCRGGNARRREGATRR